jgi:hypothetical protein
LNSSKLQIGAPIDSWCTGCKTDQPHVVATLKTDGTLNKVKCNSCGAEHVYRKPKSESEEKKSSGGKRKKSDSGAVSEAEASKAKPYSMEAAYQQGDVIEHHRFGFGRVLSLKPGGKMEVAFPDGTKIMVCRDVGLLATRRAARSAPKVVVEPEPEEEPAVAVEADEPEGEEAAATDEEE